MAEVLKPREFGELLSQTFSVAFRSLGKLLAIEAIFWLLTSPLFIGGIYAFAALEARLREMDFDGEKAVPLESLFQLFFAGSFTILMHVPQAACSLVIADRFTGNRTSIAQAFVIACRRFWGLIGVGLVLSLLVFIWLIPGFVLVVAGVMVREPTLLLLLVLTGTLLLIVGMVVALICTAMFSVSNPALLLERASIAQALTRSRALTRGFRARILVMTCMIGALSYFLSSFLSSPLDTARETMEGTRVVVDRLMQVGSQVVASALGGLLPSALVVVIYFDLRVRKDGFDLEKLAELVDVIRERAAGGRHGAPADSSASGSALAP